MHISGRPTDALFGRTAGSRMVRGVVAAAITVNLFVAGLTVAVLAASYAHYRDEAARTVATVAGVLDSEIEGLIRTIDLGLEAVADEVARENAAGGLDPDALRAVLAHYSARLPDAAGLRVADAQGTVRLEAGGAGGFSRNLSDRDYFRRLRDDPAATVVVSDPLPGRAGGPWAFRIARRLTGVDRHFDGAVVATVPVALLTRIFSSVDLGPGRVVSLFSDRGRYLARYPTPLGGLAGGGEDRAAGLRAVAAPVAGDEDVLQRSPTDGVVRFVHFHKVIGYPLYLVVGMARSDALTGWRREVATMVGLAVLFVLATSGATALFLRAWQQRAAAVCNLETARAQAIEARRASELLLGSVGEGIYGLDRRGVCTFANPMAASLLGWRVDDLVGRDLHDTVHHTHCGGAAHAAEACPIRLTIHDGVLRRVSDDLFWRRDGTSFPVEYTATPIVEDGVVTGAVVVFRDLTERKAAAEALERQRVDLERSNAELERFAYVASHDLQEPLRTVVSFAQLLDRRFGGQLGEEGEEYIRYVVAAGQRMHRLINDLLVYSRIGAGERRLVPVSAQAACAEAVENLHDTIGVHGARVTVGPLPLVLGDAVQLTQLFQNLIANAVKFREPDVPPAVTVSAERDGAFWRFSVADNGIGFDPGEQDVFEIFRRLHSTDAYPGTGVGLAICKRIVEGLGGRIWAASRPGEGASFNFTLKAA